MPRSHKPAARDGKDAVQRPGRWRPVWALAALLAALLAAPHVAAQNGGEKPQLWFSQDPKGQEGKARRLRLRPNFLTKVYLHIYNEAGPARKVEVALFSGEERVPGASKVLDIVKGVNPVIFGEAPPPKEGKAPPPKGGKAPPLPLAEIRGPLSFRLFDLKTKQQLDVAPVGVAAPKEYVTAEAVFDPRVTEDGKSNVLEIKLNAGENFYGEKARVELVLPPERIPDLLPGKKTAGANSYGGWLRPGTPLVLRAENLKFRDTGQLRQGLFYVTIDGYPRAFSWVSSFAAEKADAQPRSLSERYVMRLRHPKFAKPGAKVPVIVEVDNMPADAYGTLTMYREFKEVKGAKVLAGPEDEPRRFTTDRAQVLLFNPAGPAGALVFDSKVGDHEFLFDTKDLYGVRYLAASMADKSKDVLLEVLDSKKIPELGMEGAVKRIVQPLLLYEGGPELVLDVNLPPPPKGSKLPELRVGAPLPLKALTKDPTGVVKAEFFLGKPLPDGKLPPVVVEGEQLPDTPGVWVAELPAPTEKALLLFVGVQVTNGLGEKATRTIKIQLVDPKAPPPPGAKLATITGTVTEGDRPQMGVPVTLSDDLGKIKGATKTDKAGKYKFEKVLPGAYVVVAARSASKTRGQALVSVPPEVVLVENVDIMLLRTGKQ